MLAALALSAVVASAAGPAAAADAGPQPEASSAVSSSSLRTGGPGGTTFRPTYRDQLGGQASAETLSNGANDLNSGSSTSVMPYQPYTDWSWADQGYTSTTETLTVDDADLDSHYFWAYDFAVGGTGVGYTGLQTGSYPTNGKIALFAIWGADAAQGTECEAFDGEGVGWTCRIDPFEWTEGRPYVLRIAVDGSNSDGTWYKATIRDVARGTLHTIGRIHHPVAGGRVTGRGSWTEWFGSPSATCEALKRSHVRWGLPTSDDGRVKTTGHTNHTESKDGSNSCSGSTSVADEKDSVSQKVGPK